MPRSTSAATNVVPVERAVLQDLFGDRRDPVAHRRRQAQARASASSRTGAGSSARTAPPASAGRSAGTRWIVLRISQVRTTVRSASIARPHVGVGQRSPTGRARPSRAAAASCACSPQISAAASAAVRAGRSTKPCRTPSRAGAASADRAGGQGVARAPAPSRGRHRASRAASTPAANASPAPVLSIGTSGADARAHDVGAVRPHRAVAAALDDRLAAARGRGAAPLRPRRRVPASTVASSQLANSSAGAIAARNRSAPKAAQRRRRGGVDRHRAAGGPAPRQAPTRAAAADRSWKSA